MKRKGGLGWLPESVCRAVATPEVQFWQNTDLNGLVVYDIGAFHGLLTLFFCRTARHVVAYEPVDANRRRLIENVTLNKLSNVTVRSVALSEAAGQGVMCVNTAMSGASRLTATSSPQARRRAAETVQVTTLDDDLARNSLPEPQFIKIDVEGLELHVVKGAQTTLRRCRPDLFLEMHGETMAEKVRKATEIVAFLFDLGYRDIIHVESGSRILPGTAATAARGHLYCRGAAIRKPIAA